MRLLLSPSQVVRKLLFSFCAAGIIAAVSLNTALAHPRHQHDDAQASASLRLSEADQLRLNELTAQLNNNPENAQAAVAFARFAATQARRLGDTMLLRRAAEILAPWESVENPPISVLLVRANIKQIDHRFDAALNDLNQAIRRNPVNPQARLSRAFILSTIGDADSAAADCAALRANISIYIRETCRARVNGLVGAIDEADARMEALLGVVQPASPAERLFALSIAADIAERQGAIVAAEVHYKEMLSIDDVSVYARAAYANFLVTQDRLAEARDTIGDAPHTEALLLLRVLAADHTSDAVAKSAARELSLRMAVDRAEGDFSHAREYARFALDHMNDAVLALEMAQENWQVQKEPVDARILVRSAMAAHTPSIIDEMRIWVAKTGLQDYSLDILLIEDGLENTGKIQDKTHAHASVIE
ncbi:MAG: hypothetical protein AAF936_16935 [Pseudomonadota bacterium]